LKASQFQTDKSELHAKLFSALGGDDKPVEQSGLLSGLDLRSRTNSLRNGETSKVIQNVDLECPCMDKEDYEEYLQFRQQKHKSIQSATRKMSFEYFKEESKKLEQKIQKKVALQKPAKKFTCFNKSVRDINAVFASQNVAQVLQPRQSIESMFSATAHGESSRL
jgi:virulence-associated protein VapD